MPRARRANLSSKKGNGGRGSRPGARADSEASEDEAASEILSHCSSASETVSLAEEGSGSDVLDNQAQQDQREDKLREDIDNLMDKSIKTRQVALSNLRLALSSHTLGDFLMERRVTFTDALERCLKKGKEEEQSLAATVLSLLCIQLGSGPEGEEVFRCLKPLLISILTDSSAGVSARQSCAASLGLCCYIAAADVEDLINSVCCLEGIISSYNSDCGTANTALHSLLCCAIQSWALLLTVCPASRIQKILESHLPRLPGMLSSENVNLRIAAGECLALLYELARDLDEDFFYEDTDALCVTLKKLATDSNKYRAKTDRRKQRSIFRDVLHYVESGEFQEETIKFGLEVMYVDSWTRRRTYSSFKEALGSGIRFHLQYNEVLRDIFSLGSPLVLDAAAIKASKISRVEKHMFNSAAFKARTKARNRVRDKRADVL
ncbi:interferon-related developmental regulator 2 isoform X2 [Spea bombifrons]|uniref:interferon-related developmental regulator 2 isoform X2 n=1 Tax=Spea bombifrons TaxID=233779 RepID=UPI002348F08B|nr:interferon-related developmental regulator 2 isoform X2 [Spea bombifrons]